MVPELDERDTMTCKSDIPSFLKKAGTWKNVAWSFKVDGVRVWATSEPTTVGYRSRGKKAYDNFYCFDATLKQMAYVLVKRGLLSYPVIFDGEVVGKTGGFSKIMTQARRLKDVDNSCLDFLVFDIVVDLPFYERRRLLEIAFQGCRSENVKLLCHYPIFEGQFTEVGFTTLMSRAVSFGYEGIVFKTFDGPYEHKQSSLWCKVKPEETIDARVTGKVEGEGKHAGKLGALLCEYSGGAVSVGGGYSDKEREEFWENPPAIIEIAFQEKTKDSLRFPRFVRVRDDKTEVN